MPKEIKRIGESFCLELANTVVYRKNPSRKEDKLTDFAMLLRWGKDVGLLTETEFQNLKRSAKKNPEEADTVWQRSVFLRELIIRIFSAIARKENPMPSDLTTLNAMLPETMSRLRIIPAKTGMDWKWSGWNESLDSLLWPIIYSAGNLLTSTSRFLVKECDGPGCGWFFIDRSRNRRRRWCNMSDCGNREKVRRFYQRQRAEKHQHF
jgi:predicted RNA-binding Zn ribbon-like protein